MTERLRIGAVIALAAMIGSLVLSSGQARALEPVTTVEGITEYRLDNGLKVLLMPDSSRPTTTVNVTYMVGSKHEGYGETGMAHLLEHMLFYGTEDHPDITREISERGGMANGTTWFDRTNYFQTLPAEEENLEWAIRMEADRMVNSVIDEEDLASEMTVVRNEYEMGESNPFRVLMQRVLASAYMWHGYGRSTIGARSDIENVPIGRLHDFYRKYYQPDNAVVIVSGNYRTERALELIETHFGAIPRPVREGNNTLWPTYTLEPVQDGEREVIVRRSGHTQSVMAAFHVPAGPHEEFPAVEVLGHVLGDTPSGRLYKALIETEKASRVGAFTLRLAEPGIMIVFAELSGSDDRDEVRRILLETIDEVRESPPSEEEVRRATNALSSNMEQMLNNSERVGVGLSEWEANGDWRLMFLHRDRLEEVTAEDVGEVAGKYLKSSNRTLGQFIPESDARRAEVPPPPDVGELLADYEGREDRAAGEDFEATPENIEDRMVRFDLDNGARVALLPKSTRGGRVNGSLAMRMGDEESLTGLGHVPGATRAMLNRGTENYSRQEIRDRLDDLRSSLGIGGSASMVTMNIESRGEYLDELVDLMAEILMRPEFPERELSEWRRSALTSVDRQRDEPSSVASQALSRHFEIHDPDHPFYAPDFDEQIERIESVDQDQLIAFHDRMYGFGPGTTLTLVGDFDADEMRTRLESLFGDWTPSVGFQRMGQSHLDVEPGDIRREIPDKANAVLLGRHTFPMRDDHEDYPALVLGGYLIGGGFLNSRLARRIRQDEGISYGVGGNFSAHSIDERGQFNLFAMFNPDNRDRLREVMVEELEKVLEEGFDAEELETGKQGWLRQQQVMRGDDSRLAGMINSGLYLDRDLFHQARLEEKVMALTDEEVTEAVRRHLDIDSISYAEAGDFRDEESEEVDEEGS